MLVSYPYNLITLSRGFGNRSVILKKYQQDKGFLHMSVIRKDDFNQQFESKIENDLNQFISFFCQTGIRAFCLQCHRVGKDMHQPLSCSGMQSQ
jgi:hypothetical protein